MDMDKLLFFNGHEEMVPVYELLEKRILAELEDVTVKVQKTQISFCIPRMFACVSFARVRPKKQCPDPYMVVTLGLGHKLESPRVAVATEPYPNRWTHHILITHSSEIDGELMEWLKEAGRFSAAKR